ncbi:MAG: RidA family protein [Chloroflexota bacterium]|nr:RidA family protein [Dehalococcoidia bacterium]MDW8254611.1 RidA family protein [Chloroflexota bacterium]
MTPEERLAALGLSLPPMRAPRASYLPVVRLGELLFVAGHVAIRDDGSIVAGKVGRDLTVEEGYDAARRAALAILASLKAELGELRRIQRIVRLLCLVNCTDDLVDHPRVANGASDLLIALFGESGRHARAAVGVASLPGGACVEIEAIVHAP